MKPGLPTASMLGAAPLNPYLPGEFGINLHESNDKSMILEVVMMMMMVMAMMMMLC